MALRFSDLAEGWMKLPFLRQETVAGEVGWVRGVGARAEGDI